MKAIILYLLSAILFFSCKKSSNNINTSATALLGKWVNAAQRLDTLDVYIENSKLIMFDNSLYLRTNYLAWINYDYFKREVKNIQDELIFVRPYKSNSGYIDNYFKWLTPNSKFEIQVQALHPERSALYNITYEKVQ
ncbi:MAG: hypothetical protein EKK37_18010 [Sphingobacteriales bacterium]|nr:MAG: hypothetical protein EKK37_18010 [Sphingobacteriales bacterium]